MINTPQQFDLTRALARLHEQDWLAPGEPNLVDYQAEFVFENQPQFAQRSYWIAQLTHCLQTQFHLGPSACARILRLTTHSVVNHAISRYPKQDFASLAEVIDTFNLYIKRIGEV